MKRTSAYLQRKTAEANARILILGERLCPQCSQSLVRRIERDGELEAASLFAKRKFCSHPCATQWNGPNKVFKGDAATREAKRYRARKLFQLPAWCERCRTARAIDRHHRDGDPGHNDIENIAFLCRRCHMIEDGRLARLTLAAPHPGPQSPTPCLNCSRLFKPLRLGLCEPCYDHQRHHGVARPPRPVRTPRKYAPQAQCPQCGRIRSAKIKFCQGLCFPCYKKQWRRAKKAEA